MERFKVVKSAYEDGSPRVGVLDTETDSVALFLDDSTAERVAQKKNSGKDPYGRFVYISREEFEAPLQTQRFKVVKSIFKNGTDRWGVLDSNTDMVAPFGEGRDMVIVTEKELNSGESAPSECDWISRKEFEAPMKERERLPVDLTPMEIHNVWDEQAVSLSEMLFSDLNSFTQDQIIRICNHFYREGADQKCEV